MDLLERMRREGVEEIVAVDDPASGLSGFVVIHDTTRGPAAGGIRLYRYGSESEALEDGLRLARAMSLKAAAAELPVGGGKIVLLDADPPRASREELLRGVGRLVESLGGRFLAGRDVGVPVEHGHWVRAETRFMVDESAAGVGDLNRATAIGVEAGARAALGVRLGRRNWRGVRVAIQGAGGVGSWLARLLAAEGASLLVADIDEGALERLAREVSFERCPPETILEAEVDVLSPCALGGVLTAARAEGIRAAVVAGSANNVLATPEAGRRLFERGIAYAPDFVVNAGALVQGVRFLLYGERRSDGAVREIGGRVEALLVEAGRRGRPPERLAEEQARRRLGGPKSWRRWSWPATV